jgi:hypothetical protein
MVPRGFTIDDRDQSNDSTTNMGLNECNRVFSALLVTGLNATRSRNRNNLRANDLFTRRINDLGGTPDTCVYYVINEDLIAQRPTNAAIAYTPEDGRVVAIEP